MLSSIIGALAGFVFWIIAAQTSSSEEIGIAAALISSLTFLVTISRLGMDQSIVRYITTRDPSSTISTGVIVTSSFAFILGLVFILGIEIWSPKLIVIKSIYLPFLAILIGSSATYIIGNSFVAMKQSHLYLIQNIILSSRVLMLPIFGVIGYIGIFISFGFGVLLAFCFSLFILSKLKISLRKFNFTFLKESFRYSLGSYFSASLFAIPSLMLPVIVLNMLGASATGFYYMAMAIASIVFIIPNSLSTSLFVEGSHGESLRASAIRALVVNVILLTPIIIIIYTVGEMLLSFVGHDYAANGFSLLKILVLTGYFMGITQTYYSIALVQKKIGSLALLGIILSTLLIGFSIIFINIYGLNGIGLAWLVGYCITALIIVISLRRHIKITDIVRTIGR